MDQMKLMWHRIAEKQEAISFSSEGIATVEVANKMICIILFKDELYACNASCPHAGGKMAAGYIDALGNIVCPVHQYKFSLQHGRNTSGEGYTLKTYPVEKNENGIFIGI